MVSTFFTSKFELGTIIDVKNVLTLDRVKYPRKIQHYNLSSKKISIFLIQPYINIYILPRATLTYSGTVNSIGQVAKYICEPGFEFSGKPIFEFDMYDINLKEREVFESFH